MTNKVKQALDFYVRSKVQEFITSDTHYKMNEDEMAKKMLKEMLDDVSKMAEEILSEVSKYKKDD